MSFLPFEIPSIRICDPERARFQGGNGSFYVVNVCGMTRRQKREAPISYRPPTGLSAAFRERVLNSGLSINAYITQSIFCQAAGRAQRVAPIDQKMVAQLLSKSARISDRLEAVSQHNSASHELLLEECRSELAEIRTCLMAVLGRSP